MIKNRILFILFVFFIVLQAKLIISAEKDPDGEVSWHVYRRGFVIDLISEFGVQGAQIFYEVAYLPPGGSGEDDWLYKSDTDITSSNGWWACDVWIPRDEVQEFIYEAWEIIALPSGASHGIGPDGWNSTTLRRYEYAFPDIVPPTNFYIYDDTYDTDKNLIHDDHELPLAEKFCPMIILHHPTEWIAPEPVEYIGVSKSDLWFILYNQNGQQVGDYPITSQGSFNPAISYYHPWITSPSCQNYSTLTGNGYNYTGTPPGKAYGYYLLRFHYNYAGTADTPSSWISSYNTERTQNNFPHTIYAHLFLYNNKPVIQYWMFYPYNDGYNNHEGDWEHINVRISTADPSEAIIETVDYYFHHKVKTMTSGFPVYQTHHPYIYVGGSCAGINPPFSCQSGNATGGSYPWPGTWYNVGTFGYDEYVNGSGPGISHSSLNVVVIPNRDKINYDLHPEMSWLNVPIRWGILESSSPWDGIEGLLLWTERDIGNDAPKGPTYNKGWGTVGPVEGGYDAY